MGDAGDASLRTVVNLPSRLCVMAFPEDAKRAPFNSVTPGEKWHVLPEEVWYENDGEPGAGRWTVDPNVEVCDRGLTGETVLLYKDDDGGVHAEVPQELVSGFHKREILGERGAARTVLRSVNAIPTIRRPITPKRAVTAWWTQSENVLGMIVGSVLTYGVWIVGAIFGLPTLLVSFGGLAAGYTPLIRNAVLTAWDGNMRHINEPNLQAQLDKRKSIVGETAYDLEHQGGIKGWLLRHTKIGHRRAGVTGANRVTAGPVDPNPGPKAPSDRGGISLD